MLTAAAALFPLAGLLLPRAADADSPPADAGGGGGGGGGAAGGLLGAGPGAWVSLGGGVVMLGMGLMECHSVGGGGDPPLPPPPPRPPGPI